MAIIFIKNFQYLNAAYVYYLLNKLADTKTHKSRKTYALTLLVFTSALCFTFGNYFVLNSHSLMLF